MKELVEDGFMTFTERQRQRFDAWCEMICDTCNDGSFWSEDDNDEDYHGGGYECADYDNYYFYNTD